jgi:ubiquitin-small subunit ribosomal protein S27Ae
MAAKDAKSSVKYHITSKRQKNYTSGKTKNKFCPKCGAGVMLAEHKDRLYCGKCHYMEKR